MFKWSEYLDLAQVLIEQSPLGATLREAALRSAVSRTYYGAYGLILEWASSRHPDAFIPSRTGRDHGALRAWLRKRQLSEAAQDLEQLHDWRKQCDYDDDVVQLDVTCPQALSTARTTVTALGIGP